MDRRAAVVIELFETADDMAAVEGPLDAMEPGETPGTGASITAELGSSVDHRRGPRDAGALCTAA